MLAISLSVGRALVIPLSGCISLQNRSMGNVNYAKLSRVVLGHLYSQFDNTGDSRMVTIARSKFFRVQVVALASFSVDAPRLYRWLIQTPTSFDVEWFVSGGPAIFTRPLSLSKIRYSHPIFHGNINCPTSKLFCTPVRDLYVVIEALCGTIFPRKL